MQNNCKEFFQQLFWVAESCMAACFTQVSSIFFNLFCDTKLYNSNKRR